MGSFLIGGAEYDPGKYEKQRPGSMDMVDKYFEEWEAKQLYKGPPEEYTPPASICLSRAVGSGALEIGDLVSEKVGFPVVDRALLELICESSQLSERTVNLYDERHPGVPMAMASWLFGEKTFTKGDYAKELLRAVGAIAGLGSNIFVGRGVHLILPRDRILAVRITASKNFRMQRMSQILDIDLEIEKASSELEKIDQEQRNYFKKSHEEKGIFRVRI